MTYAIIGSGAIGAALAHQFARQQLPVRIANTRGADSLRSISKELGHSIEPSELSAALEADIILLALPFASVFSLADKTDWRGKIVIDATNAIDFSDFSPADLGGRLSTSMVAEALSGARVVKAFNTLPAAVLAGDPRTPEGKRVLFLSSDDESAASEVSDLIQALGFAPISLGRIDEGGRLQQFGGRLMVHSFIKQAG